MSVLNEYKFPGDDILLLLRGPPLKALEGDAKAEESINGVDEGY